jgi:hypothetical protein
VRTEKSVHIQESLIRDFALSIALAPIEQDVYMAIATDADVYSFGADEVLKKEIVQSLANGLRGLPNLFWGGTEP